MKRILLGLILLISCGLLQSQTVFDPNDAIVNYNSGAAAGSASNPTIPYNNRIVKWVRTPKASITWSTTRYKCYMVDNLPFRMRYPNSYVPGVNDGKKYPVMIFWHGGGEANANVYDNEYQLYQGGQAFETKVANDQDAFILFAQTPYVGWDVSQFAKMMIVIDSIVANAKGDADRVISMGLSMGGLACINFALSYPQKVASVISSSPAGVNNNANIMGPAIHLPLWLANGGRDTNPDSATTKLFTDGYTASGGVFMQSYFPRQGHVLWDYQWAEEPRFDSMWSTAHKANPLVFNDNRFFCPGNPVSARMGITPGFYAYQWDKDGVVIPGATGNEYIATSIGTYRARFQRTSASAWSDWSLAPAKITAVCPPIVGTGTGLKGNYYSGTTLTTLAAARVDAIINLYTEQSAGPITGIAAGASYSTRWIGRIQPQFTETYTISTLSDDGIRVWINGVPIIDNWTVHGRTINTGTYSFIAGQKYDIKIEYYNLNNFQNVYNNINNYNTGIAALNWSSPSTVFQLVPKSQLYPEGTGDPDLPLCTTNVTPANAAVLPSATSTTLTWNPVFNATSYDVYVYTGATVPGSPTANVTTTSYNAVVAPGNTYNWFVVPRNVTGAAVGCSTSNKTTFTIAGPVPACVINTSPANASTIATQTTANLTWPAAATATSYDVYIWTGATAPVTPTANTASTSYSATGLTASTLYNWYIAPRNANGPATTCGTSNKTTFTTAAPIPVPSCVTNTAPTNGTTLATQTTATLTWAAAATATSYDVYIWTGATAPVTPTANSATTTYNVTGLTAGTVYNWYIAPRNASGPAVNCAATNTSVFTTASVIIPVPGCAINSAPVDGSTVATQTAANLSWSASATATSYDVYIWTGATAPVTPTANVTATTYSATGLTASTLYNWYVIPKNASGPAVGCDATNKTTFTTAAIAVPVCATNTLPANASTIGTQTTATLTWGSVATATSYDVYIWTGATAPVTPTANVTAATYSATGLTASTLYNWYVIPKNASGPAVGCDATNKTTFTTAAIPVPVCATNTLPANASTIGTQTTATLTWGSVATATSYDVYIWTGATAPVTPTANVTSATYSATGLTASTLYNWYVIPKNASGPAVGCDATNKTTFTTAAIPVPVCATNTLPVNASTIGTQTTATLTWGSVATATSYDVYIWTGATAPVTPTANVATATYGATGLTASTLYNWYVIPKNASGPAVGCDATNKTTFTTAAIAVPVCATNTLPANASTIGTQTTATLTWGSVATATSYDVYIWTGATAPVTPTANVTAATYSATGLTASTLYNWYVIPKNASGPAVGCDATNATTFTTAAIPVPVCATNTLPVNASTIGTQTTATLTWGAVATATSYDVYIWTGATAPVTPTANVATATYGATGLTASTLYNWYVIPKNASGPAVGCDATNKTTFTTAAIAVPVCATNTLPVNASTIGTQTTATLTWGSVATATSYDVYIWTGATAPVTPTANVATATYSATGLTASTLYNWYVIPKNASGPAVGCDATNATTFTTAAIPVPVCATNTLPANASTIGTQTTATLTWGSVATATSYDVYIWTGATAPVTPTANVTSATYSATGLTASTLYNWYVIPKNASGPAVGCDATNKTTFTTAAIPVPVCATNTLPVNASTIGTQTTATLTWGSVATATSYDVYIWTGATAPVTPTANVTAATYSATGLTASTLYNWYVIPKNASGPAVGCDATNKTTFTTAAIPVPVCATNTLPVNASTIGTQTTATLTWGSVATATSYDVYIWTGATAPVTPTANVATATYGATGLTASTLYNWYVIPKNASGPAVGCDATNATTFTTAAIPVPVCATNTLPVNASTIGTQTTATLTWGSVATATSYDVYIWTGATAPVTPTANVATATYGATGLTASTLYNWYVIPKNASGPAVGCDATNKTTFTTAAIPVPVCATNTLPANASTIGTQTTATLTWGSVATATSYDVYIWTGATAPVTPTANVATATYGATGLTASTLYNWYVIPKNASGPAVGCDATNATTFTTAAIPVPVCATNTLPANASTIGTQTTATLTWGSVATATSYDVYIWTGATAPVTPTANVTAATYSATGLTASTLYNWYVIPKNASGPAVGCDATNKTTFTTAAIPVPVCATNNTPANGATIATETTATLTWGTVASATSYDVYIWTGATVPVTPTANVTATTYSTTGLTASTQYNWYVVPKNASGPAVGCDVTNVTTFTTAAAIPVPSCVTNTAPSNGTTLATQTTATLTWGTAATATSYDVYIWTGAIAPVTPTANVATATYNATGLTAGTVYNWYIAPRNASGPALNCAATNMSVFTTASATIPVPVCATNSAPVNGSTIGTQTTATLTWGSVATATSYDVYIWTGATAPVTPTANVATATYSATGLTASTLYNWYVVPKNATGPAVGCDATNATTFTTAAIPVPVCATNTLPVNASTIGTQTTATLTWGAVATATSYDVYIWTGATAPVTPTANVATATYGATGLTASTLYNWYVIPKNASGPAVGCDATNKTTFTTAAIAVPVCATNTLPVNASTIGTQTTATLTWGSVATATSYDVYIWTGATAPVTPTANVATATYSATGLTASTLYNWYVIPKNASGPAVGCDATNATTFTTAAIPVPVCATNTLPANASTIGTQTTATLTWGSVATATSYDVYIWTGATAPVTPTANVTSATYSATGLTASTLYNWYVIPKNASGPAVGCDATNKTTFTTAAIPVPVCATNTLPVNASTIGTQTTATLTWGSVATATSYDVYIWTGATAPVTPTANVTAATYSATGLTASTLYNWYVIPKNASGPAVGCDATNKTTFTTAAIPVPVCATNTLPVNASTIGTQTTATLTWGSVATATSYDVYIWTGATAPVTPTANVATATYGATGLTASTLYNWYVIPKNASGPAVGCDATNKTTFTTAAIAVPVCATNTLPANASTIGTQTTATLTWGSVATATSYDVYIWTGATAPVTPTANVTAATYSATGLTASTLYNWYVIPKNASGPAVGCDATNKTTFTTAAIAVPVCATNTLPANASTIGTQTTATLTWGSVATATSYDVYIWTGATAPVTPTANVTAATYSATGLTASTLYNWYVIPKNASGPAVGCDATNATTFTTAAIPVPACATNTLPANASTIGTQTTATLTWGSVATATSYDVYIWTGATAPVTPTANVATAIYGATGLTASTLYNWYVIPKNASGPAVGCDATNKTTFTTAAIPVPVCATNTLPVNASTIGTQTTATLTWGSVATATSYDVYIWTGATAPVTPTANVTSATYSATGLTASTLYNWYVIPKNASGPAVGCDATNKTTFTTAAIPVPVCATNTLPVNASTIGTQTTATLTWGSVATATSYDVYIWTGATAPVTPTANVTAATYSATGLTASTLYNWYVIPKNASGPAVGCDATNATTFTTAASITIPACVTNTLPVNGATLPTQTSARLSWPASAGATSYDVYLAAGNAVPTVLVSNTTALTYYATTLTAGTLYSWYIAPRNANGANTACGTTNRTTFTTAVATGGGNISPVSNAGSNTSITLPLSSVTLDGSLSYDPDGRIAEFYWYQISAPVTVTISTPFSMTPTITGLTTVGVYTIGLQVKDNNGVTAYSQVTVTVNQLATVPSCVTNSTPVAGAVLTTQNTATLTWPAAAGATSYDVYLAAGSGIPTTLVGNTTSLSYSANGLTANTLYSWYIAPRNSVGAATTCAAANTTTFTTAVAVPACVINTSPAAGTTLASQTSVTLTWPASAGATSYDVYLAAGTGTPTTLVANTAALTYTSNSLSAGITYSWYIAPRNAGGAATTCGASNTTTFTAAAPTAVPSCVINTSPAAGTVLTTQTSVTLTWPAAANATSYDVYLAAGTGTPTTLVTNTTALTYTSSSLAAGTTYSWYIAPRNAVGVATGCGATNTTTFTTASVPACVTNTLPVNGATLPTQTSARLSWPASAGATSYDVYLAAGNAVPTVLVSNTTALTYYATTLTAGTLYSWYIAPRNANGANTACGTTNRTTFTTAVATGGGNISPVSNAGSNTSITLPLSSVTLDGSLSYDPDGRIAEFYWYQISAPVTVTISTPFSMTPTITGLTTVGVYTIGLQVKDNNGAAAYSQVTVTVNQLATVPSCVTNSTPVAGAVLTTQNTATLTWPAAAGATSYDVYLAAGSGIPTTLVGNTTSLSYSASGLTANTLYSWYIAPRNSVGAATTCAAANTTTFTTAVAVPACVINTSPAAGTTLASQTSVTLTWPASAGATSYDVYLAAGTGTPTTLVANTAALTYTSNSLSAGITYSWYIAPRNAGGAATTCGASNTTTFTAAAPTAVPSCVINTSPAAGTVLTTQTSVTLTWPAAANATSYDVYLAAGTGTPTTLVTNTTALTYTSSSLAAGTTYSWYIAPRNAVGVATGCGATNTTTFTTASVPACVTNTLPVNGATLPTQTSARLSWPASAGATSYDVYLAAGNAVPTVLVSNTTALTYYATTLTAGTLYSWYIAPRNANGANTACGTTNRTTFTTAVATGGGNISPVSNAGSNTSITLPLSSVTLDGSLSYDPDGRIAEFYWYQISAPVTVTIGTPFSMTPTITGLTTAGNYTIGLQVKDNNGVTAYSQVIIAVSAAGARIADVTTLLAQPVTAQLSVTGSTVATLSSTISPNPVKPGQSARLKVTSDKTGTATVNIINSNGFIVSQQRLSLVKGINNTMVNTSSLSQGFYIVNIVGGSKPLNIKLLIE